MSLALLKKITNIEAISSCPVSSAFHNGEFPSESKTDMSAPLLHKFSTTRGKCRFIANCNAVRLLSEDLNLNK